MPVLSFVYAWLCVCVGCTTPHSSRPARTDWLAVCQRNSLPLVDNSPCTNEIRSLVRIFWKILFINFVPHSTFGIVCTRSRAHTHFNISNERKLPKSKKNTKKKNQQPHIWFGCAFPWFIKWSKHITHSDACGCIHDDWTNSQLISIFGKSTKKRNKIHERHKKTHAHTTKKSQ